MDTKKIKTSESGNDAKREKVRVIPIQFFDDFPKHPFNVKMDEEMEALIESIKEFGILTPLIARKKENERYEIIAGHRRKFAAKKLGFTELPVILRDMTRDEAVIAMVDSNLHRERILPSERAYAYKMKMEARKRQGARTDLTSTPVVSKLRTDEAVGNETGESREQIRRYIRLTYLIKELLDNKEVTFTWEDEAKVTVTKDGAVIEYKSGDKLTDDGSYTITFENFDGAKTSYEFVIDTEPVAIAAEGHKANLPVANPVIVHITEEDATAVLIKDGKEVGAYVSGTAVSDEGDYIVRVTDKAGNVSEVAFEIDKSVDFAINVNDRGLSNSVVIEANEGAEIIVTKDGNVIEYKEGTAITEPGKYTVKVTDALDNTTERSFIIVTPVSTGFSHSFDETAGFEKVIINGEETRLNYGALELTEDGTYEVGVVVNGKTYTFTTVVDCSVDYTINVHDKGFANTVTLNANENVTLTMSKDGEPMEYKLGTEILEPGVYTVKMGDTLGNVKELSFTIVNALYGKFDQEIDEMPGFNKVLVNGEEVTLEKGTLSLTASGTYEVTIVANGNEQKFTVVVDSTAPVVTIDGVENGGTTKGAVILSDLSSDATMKVYLDDELVEYNLGDELTDVGVYRIVLEDAAGNVSEYSFEILWKMPAVAIVLIVIAVLGVVGTVVWLVISNKRKDEYYN